MKVLLQNSIFFPNVIGGAELSTHLLGIELRQRGLAVDAVATTGKRGAGRQITTRATEDGLGTVFEAPAHGFCDIYERDGLPPQPGLLVRGLHHFAGVNSGRWRDLFGEVLERARPDVVHTNTIVGMTPAIWSAAQRRGVPVVHTLRDYHLLCPRTTLLRSDNTDCTSPPLPCRLLAALKLRQTHGVDVVTAPSRFVLERHQAAGGFAGARGEVVPNACEYLPPEVPDRSGDGPMRGLFLGQVAAHKGLLLLLEALATLFDDPDCGLLEFDFAGTGPDVPQLEAFCAAHPERARFHGVVKGEDKFALLRRADFLTIPSVWNDNFPRSILDGFSWGLPVIGTDRGGIPEVIRHDQDGVIIPAQAGPLAAAIRTYLVSPEIRLAHGRSARQRADAFTLDRQVDRFQAIYASVAAGAEPRP